MTIRGSVAACACVIALIMISSGSARAQGGAIVGTVTDKSGAAMAAAKVTVSGPAMMGERSVVTGANGEYRITPLDPGVYRLVFESAGFGLITREGINITVGFTATINAEMSPASVAQTVEVTSASPVVDLEATNVTTDVGTDVLQNLTGKRDYASVLNATPGINLTRPDVGGSGAITYQRSTRYGMMGQDRGEVEGIVTTEAAAGGQELPYTDVNSFQDMVLSVIGNNAEMPQPGTLAQAVVKSGGNSFHGHVYEDWEGSALESFNINAQQIATGLAGGPGEPIQQTDRLQSFHDFSGDIGGYLKKDKLWWYFAYRRETESTNLPNLVDATQVGSLPVYTVKGTYNLTQNNHLTGYYQRGTKLQNPELQTGNTQIVTREATSSEYWPSGLYTLGWESILSKSLVLVMHIGTFFEAPHHDTANDTIGELRYSDIGANTLVGNAGSDSGGHSRYQINGNLSYLRNGWLGTHNFKFGGEYYLETSSGISYEFDNEEMILNNGVPSEVVLYLPSTYNRSRLRVFGLYAQDSWRPNSRLTLNLGVRFDQYFSYDPPQLAPTGLTFSRLNGPLWNNVGPRLGAAYALTKDGKTLAKANFGQFWQSPYVALSGLLNPNAVTSSTYVWTPANPTIVNGLPVFQQGQQGALISATGVKANGQPSVTAAPNLQNTYLLQGTAYVEREVAPNFGVRTGFVWNAWRQAYGEVNTNAPYSAFNVPVTVTIPGPDGKTTDSTGTVTAYNLASAYVGLPPNQVVENLPSFLGDSDYYTWEITATKRQVGRWSLMASFFKTWSYESPIAVAQTASGNVSGFVTLPPYNSTTADSPNTFINTTGGRNAYTSWGTKFSGTFNAWRGLKFEPMLRDQSGSQFARTFTTKLNYSSAVQIKAEDWGAERTATVNILDLRTEYDFNVKERWKIGLFFDLYNIFNTNAAQIVTESSGASFLRPSVITGPRIARLGAKLDF